MPQNEPTNVLTAFEMLLEEVENEIEYANNRGAKAFADRDYARVEATRSQALRLTDFRDKIASLRHEWQDLIATFEPESIGDEIADTERRNLGRLNRGARTPEDAFRIPILKALVQLGGSASIRDVLASVGKFMKSQFKEVDYEPLPSNPNLQRWRNTAQWTRNSLVKEGMMKSDSPYGVWEITELGRRFVSGK